MRVASPGPFVKSVLGLSEAAVWFHSEALCVPLSFDIHTVYPSFV